MAHVDLRWSSDICCVAYINKQLTIALLIEKWLHTSTPASSLAELKTLYNINHHHHYSCHCRRHQCRYHQQMSRLRVSYYFIRAN